VLESVSSGLGTPGKHPAAAAHPGDGTEIVKSPFVLPFSGFLLPALFTEWHSATAGPRDSARGNRWLFAGWTCRSQKKLVDRNPKESSSYLKWSNIFCLAACFLHWKTVPVC